MIIFRYLAREVYMALLAVTGILLLIFISQQFVRYLGRAAAGKISGAIVLKIMSIQLPYLLGLLLPVGLFLGILLAYGRLYVDNEMTVLSACGFSKKQLIEKTLFLSVFVMIIVASITLYVTPILRAYQARVMAGSPADLLIDTLVPGRFQASPDGQNIYYIEQVFRDTKMAQNVFVATRQKLTDKTGSIVGTWAVTSAAKGYQLTDKKKGDRYIVAVDGYRYTGLPGEKNFRIMKFHEYGMLLDNEMAQVREEYEAMNNKQLWKNRHHDLKAIAELQWRIVMPISVPVLAILAVPLSRVRPRRGRYAQLLPAILIYIVYANVMYVARDWIEIGKINPLIGLWWLPAFLLLLALLLLIDKTKLLAAIRR